jgi:hypothetical protein
MKGWYETKLWVISVIDSCTHPKQDVACRKLVKNYLQMYGKQLGGVGGDLYRATEINLRLHIDQNKYNRLVNEEL